MRKIISKDLWEDMPEIDLGNNPEWLGAGMKTGSGRDGMTKFKMGDKAIICASCPFHPVKSPVISTSLPGNKGEHSPSWLKHFLLTYHIKGSSEILLSEELEPIKK